MKIKNIQVGDWIEAKNSNDGMIEKGGLYKVLDVDIDDTVKVENLWSASSVWWVDPIDFRKPNTKKKEIIACKDLVDSKAIKLRDELIAMYPLEDK